MKEDGMCKIKYIEYLCHATYECRTVEYIYNQLLAEFELENNNLPLNAGSVVLSTVLDSTLGRKVYTKGPPPNPPGPPPNPPRPPPNPLSLS